ncbi:MAG: response regulator transcription factor [Clostridiaceae bacterium]|nr:response regulator transcription factor [Clostridiaceae bacterium]
MLAAICDDVKADREKAGEFLAQKMKSRGEPLQIEFFDRGEDIIEQYENGYAVFDIIFMDIYLRHLNGMETVRKIREYDRKVSVFFMTSCPDFAVESYEVRADGYLLKPVKQEKMDEAINRFMEERYPRMKQSLLMVNGNSGRRIAYDDIIYIESRGRNLRVVCSGGTEHMIRKKLADIQAELVQPRFLKCNQSFIVNMDYIAYADEDFTMDNGDIVPIKVRERKKIREQYFTYTLRREWGTV